MRSFRREARQVLQPFLVSKVLGEVQHAARVARWRVVTVPVACIVLSSLLTPAALAQSVCLPAPRLLTTTPMGGQVGTQIDVSVTGELLDPNSELLFSHPSITAVPKKDAEGKVIANQFVVTIANDCPVGVHDARMLTKYGISACRAFSVGTLPEQTQATPTTTLESAMELPVPSVCNAFLADKSVNHYRFEGRAGQRILVDCAAAGIDSKLKPVLIIADASGDDLMAQRRGDCLDFVLPKEGTYVLKVHDLTFQGGPYTFYRLMVREIPVDSLPESMALTREVSTFSWPPTHLVASDGTVAEASANEATLASDAQSESMAIELPCDIQGVFEVAADVDQYEFTAKQGDVWWIEVASHRLGRPTDPTVLVQRLVESADKKEWVDVTTVTDIPSPIKMSSNFYSYDGPPYNAGSSDPLGKLEIPHDGIYRLQISDLFGGTRADARNIYRLIIRQPTPDFAVVAWPLHRELRNGDRNALSKPIALRPGQTMPWDVVAIRRDGFDGPIEVSLEGLPAGVRAECLTIPAGQTHGHLLVTADPDALAGYTIANLYADAVVNDTPIRRMAHYASQTWPVTNHGTDIPAPRLMADIPVSVGSAEKAPIALIPQNEGVIEAIEGESVTVELTHIREAEFSGAAVSMQTLGAGFTGHPKFDIKLSDDSTKTVIDLAALKVAPGVYRFAFIGTAVSKYVPPVLSTDESQTAKTPPAPVDIAEILVSKPISIRVLPKPTTE